MKVYDSHGNPHFRVGDIVTRDGTDRQRVISTDGTDIYAPSLIEVECIKEPATDELSPVPWCRIGERETNMASRYSFADVIIDCEATVIAGKLEHSVMTLSDGTNVNVFGDLSKVINVIVEK